MGRTRSKGISVDRQGRRTINKEYKGVRVFLRLGQVSQQEAEARLRGKIDRIDREQALGRGDRIVWADGAARYLKESMNKRSADRIAGHVALLLPHIGALPLDQVHDGSLAPFVSQRLASGVSGTTVNRSLEIARTVLVRCARSYRDDAGRPWLAGLPALITMCEEDPRRPYPLSWDESDRLIAACPPHIAAMVEFALNVGSREGNITGLRWEWEQRVPEIGRSVFVVPASKFKTARPHVLILNDRAWAIVEAQRGKHPTHVFCWSYRGQLKPVRRINNTAWRNARKRVGLAHVREHDLRHTFGARLRAAGVSPEDRATLLGHASQGMPEHYASADIGRLVDIANRAMDRTVTRTVLRVLAGGRVAQKSRKNDDRHGRKVA